MSEDDLSTFFEHQRDPEATRMAAFPARERDTFMAHWERVLADDTVVKKTILLDGRVAGSIVSFEHSGEREVGYWIGREHWGRGVATRALRMFLAHDGTRPLYARVAGHNAASIRVLGKCGFEVCGEEHPVAGGDGVREIVLRLDA